MQKSPMVSLVILNYNGLRYLGDTFGKCFESVLKTDYPNFEIIFVDNGSTDGSIAFVTNNFYDSKIKIIKNKNNVIAEGYNAGMKVSRGKYVGLLSNDMIFDSGWLKPLIELMESQTKIGIAGSKRFLYGTKNVLDGVGSHIALSGRCVSIGAGEIDRGQFDIVRDIVLWVAPPVIRRDVLEEVGLWDSDYVIFFEDADFFARARMKGYKTVYLPTSILWHKPSTTINRLDSSRQLWYWNERSRIRFVIINFTTMRLLATFLIDFAVSIISSGASKRLFLRSYWWNFKNAPATLKRRLRYGRSPIGYAHSITGFNRNSIVKRLKELVHAGHGAREAK